MKSLGQRGEDLACAHYRNQGYQLVQRNFRSNFGRQTGEIDLIFVKDGQLVFVEVKARSNSKFGSPFEAVDFSKQRKLVRTAKLFLQQNPKWQALAFRIDVAAVDIDNLNEPVIILVNAIEDLD